MPESGAVLIEPAAGEQHKPLRGHARRKVENVGLESPIKGEIKDLSEAGLGVESSQPLEVGRQYVFRMRTRRARPEFLGEVRWCRLESLGSGDGNSAPVYRAGIALVER